MTFKKYLFILGSVLLLNFNLSTNASALPPGAVECKPTTTSTGYFTAYFEEVTLGNKQGYDDRTVIGAKTRGQIRREAACSVLVELAQLLNLEGTHAKPEILFEQNPANTGGSLPPGALAGASSYSVVGTSTDNGDLYRNIMTGQDPLPGLGNFDAFVITNFYGSSLWDIDSALNTNTYNYRSIITHEMLHALGFRSLLPAVIAQTNVPASHGTFDLSIFTDSNLVPFFNPAIENLQTPIGAPPVSFTSNKVVYRGTLNKPGATPYGIRPVYSPTTWQQGSSLSHFDMTRATAGEVYLMNPSIGTNTVRNIHTQEKEVLCQLGYAVTGMTGCTMFSPVAKDDLKYNNAPNSSVCVNPLDNDISFNGGSLTLSALTPVSIQTGDVLSYYSGLNCSGSTLSTAQGAKSLKLSATAALNLRKMSYTVVDSISNRTAKANILIYMTSVGPLCDAVYMIGGKDLATEYQDVWFFDPTLKIWNLITPNAPWGARDHHESIIFKNKLWVMGGFSNFTPHNDVWSFDGTAWTHFDNDPNTPGIQDAPWSGRGYFKTVVYNDKLWLLGGWSNNSSVLASNEVWSFDGTTWTHVDNDPATTGIQNAPWNSRYGFQAVVFNNKIWIMGGSNGLLSNGVPVFFNDVWSFDGTRWSRVDNDPVAAGIQDAPWAARYGLQAVVYGQKIWIMGGELPSQTTLNDVWSFDGKTWSAFDHDMVTPGIQNAPWTAKEDFGSVVFDNKVWILGGGEMHKPYPNFINDVWNFNGAAGSTWTHFDHNATTSGIQNAPWTARDSMSVVYSPCKDSVSGGNNTIKGTIYNDVNSNTIMDGAETGLSGVQVGLFKSGQSTPLSKIAAANVPNLGQYEFNDLPDGTYYIALIDEGLFPTMTQPAVSSGIVPGHSRIYSVPVQSGQTVSAKNFGVGLKTGVATTDISVTNTVASDAQGFYYTIKLTNTGANAAHNIIASDMLPAGITYASHAITGGTSTTYTPSTGTINIATLNAGAVTTLTIRINITGCGTLTNTATFNSAIEIDSNAANNSASVSFGIACKADLSVGMTVDTSTLAQGFVTYTIKFTNLGPQAANGIDDKDLLPDGLSYVSHTITGGTSPTYTPSTGAIKIASIVSGGVSTLTIKANVTGCGTLTNAVTWLTFNSNDPNLANNTASVSFTKSCSIDISVVKTVDTSTLAQGFVNYTIQLSNVGKYAAHNVVGSDILPVGVTYVSHTSLGGNAISYTPSTGAINVATLNAGAVATLIIKANVTGCGSITNTATFKSATEADTNAANNTSSATLTKSCDTIPPTTPGEPGAPHLNVGEIRLNWIASTDTGSGIAYYEIYRSSNDGANFAFVGTSTTNTYVDAGLAPGGQFVYKVRCKDNAGNFSAFSYNSDPFLLR